MINNKLVLITPQLGELSSLRECLLNNNNLEEIPRELSKLKNLEAFCCLWLFLRLYMQILLLSKNKLPSIDAELLGSLTSLKHLALNHNLLTELPPTIANLKNLRKLNLSYNMLTKIPSELVSLQLLTVLDLNVSAIYYNSIHTNSRITFYLNLMKLSPTEEPL